MVITRRLRKLRSAERKIIHRVYEGVQHMNGKAMAAFILQNVAEGFARGLVRELKGR